ncbi:MAG: DUF790 family protein, partial [Victivallales bacterium]|nr:DUF790 family protein [Victivallales bacterium]
VVAASKSAVAKGLLKSIDDHADFACPQDIDYSVERMRMFQLSAELLRSGRFSDEGAYHRELQVRSMDWPLSGNESYYADLPENDRLVGVRQLNPRQGIECYNIGLVQGLLLRASSMQVDVADEEPARLRRLFKYLKFFRLMATAIRNSSTGGIRLTIDGPASVLDQSKRYGMQLGSFFPAVCSLRHWRVWSEVEWKEHRLNLKLDETSGLVCTYHNFIAFSPEEIKMFECHFKETSSNWKIIEETPFLTDDNNEIFFPDFSFQNAAGVVRHLELFHRWHAKQLMKRLDYCETHPDLPLIIGVDRALLNSSELEEWLNSSAWFNSRGYLFRDYPTVDKTLRTLDYVV